jgi:hypothetical protein
MMNAGIIKGSLMGGAELGIVMDVWITCTELITLWML